MWSLVGRRGKEEFRDVEGSGFVHARALLSDIIVRLQQPAAAQIFRVQI